MYMTGSNDYAALQRKLWIVFGVAVAFAFIVNVVNRFICIQRLRSSMRRKVLPAKPTSLSCRVIATCTAIFRETSNASFAPVTLRNRTLRFESLGRIGLVLADLIVVLVFCFYGLNTLDEWSWEDIGYQTGHIALAQLPLLVVLAGKRNVVGWLVGSSHERLIYLHRWTARILFLTATVHMAFWFRDWARYDYIQVKLTTDAITKRGFAAWCILAWIVFSTFAPVRHRNYELFVAQHVVTFVGFFVAVYFHIPKHARVWIWVCLGLYAFDRVVRSAIILWFNLRRKNNTIAVGFKATFTPCGGDLLRVTIEDVPFAWKPGQHVFLSCHSVVPLQNHPFTIASIASDNRMEFIIRIRKGATSQLLARAQRALPTNTQEVTPFTATVVIDGPYGRIRPLHQFDSVVFIGAGAGVAFTLPLMRDIVRRWQSKYGGQASAACTQYVRFVWIVKSLEQQQQLQWVSSQIDDARRAVETMWRPLDKAYDPRVTLDVDVCITSSAVDVKGIIRSMLEGALGESAVVACGPPSLIDDSRRFVVALSDERAVHKGTQAQGVWFWGEGFEQF